MFHLQIYLNMSTIIKIDFNPKEADWIYVQNWLKEEDHNSGKGFYCNKRIIQNAFQNHGMAIISVDKKAIGFVTWYFNAEYSARIDITEIHPDYRKFGYGRVLINHLLQYFAAQNIYTVDLECAPVSSVHFWKKFKFCAFPPNVSDTSEKVELYKILIDSSRPVRSKVDANEVVELWNGEPFETDDQNPYRTWKLEYIKGTRILKKPIICPCDFDWRIRWRKGSEVFYDEKVKRFKRIKTQDGRYLIIE